MIPLLTNCAAVIAPSAHSGYEAAKDRRTAGTVVEDKAIQIKSMNTISAVTKNHKKSEVSASVFNTSVLLVGQVPSEQMRENIEREIARIEKVKNVHNEITVEKPLSISTRAKDSWITTRVISEMTVNRDINPNRVKVVTENGIVYLMGIVTPEEEDVAVEIIRRTKGVKKVVKVLEREPN
jgi:osmotically-inducible protein OsmY